MRHAVLILLSGSLLFGVAAGTAATRTKVPCATLKKHHKPLPARCRKKKPPKPKPPSPPPLGTIAATIQIPGETAGQVLGVYQDDRGLAFGEGSLWVADSHGLVRIDPATNSVVARIAGPPGSDGVVFAGGSVWYDSWEGGTVSRVNPQTNAVVATIPVGGGPEGMTVTPGSIWVASHYSWAVDRIDTATNTVIAAIRMPGPAAPANGPQEIASTATGIWVGLPATNQVVRIDPQTNAVVTEISAGVSCGGLAAEPSAVWVTNGGCGGRSIAKIDPASNSIEFSGVIGDMVLATDAVTAADGSVYFRVQSITSGVERVDSATDKVTGSLEIPNLPSDDAGFLEYGAGSLWVRSPGSVTRVQLSG
jgi:YVTN family beta-propeller protein